MFLITHLEMKKSFKRKPIFSISKLRVLFVINQVYVCNKILITFENYQSYQSLIMTFDEQDNGKKLHRTPGMGTFTTHARCDT